MPLAKEVDEVQHGPVVRIWKQAFENGEGALCNGSAKGAD